MRLLRAADHRVMPWRNGGGTTMEVAVSPTDAAPAGFDWRVSIAAVALDGPFSVFAGIDRTLVLIDGAGMILDIAGRDPIALTPWSAPCRFPGDGATVATLTGGPIVDLNVMTARGRYAHAVEIVTAPCDLVAGARDRVFVLAQGATVETAGDRVALGARDVVLLEPGEAARAVPTPGSACLRVTIRPVG